ncbi:putative beta-1-4-xylosyltransferase [Nymphaea thermarum]|nr:putative beta-1-4-xylosyltransferase [Nymphaea thermarum]
MSPLERSKKRIHLWKKAMIHFSLCFTMGFFTGLAPTSTSDVFPGRRTGDFRASRIIIQGRGPATVRPERAGNFNRSLMADASSEIPNRIEWEAAEFENQDDEPEAPRRLLIIVTPTGVGSPLQAAYLRRLGHTLKLVPHPLLWIVVQHQSDSPETVEILRRSGIMYRHIVCRENFTTPAESVEYQRNLALNHIEHHRLDGIVHFADAFNVYDLQFFDEIRETEVFGTWPVGMIYANKKKIGFAGAVCDGAAQVVGWHADVKNTSNYTPNEFIINTSAFAFNSTILWDPERWGRPSSTPTSPQVVYDLN